MKKFIMMLAIAIASCLWAPQAKAESYRMRYVHGNSASAGPTRSRNAKAAKEIEMQPQRTTIGKFAVRWTYAVESPNKTAIKQAITNAFIRWSARLESEYPIYIDVTLDEMASDLYAECYVKYEKTSSTSCMPTSLLWNSPKRPNRIRMEWENDAEILVNANAQWDFSTDTESSFTGMHLETMALRCIAQALGFGTTLMYYNSGVVVGEDQKFTNLCGDNVLCPYEKLIFEKYGTRLIDLDVTSKDFEEFVQPEDHDLRHILYSEDAFTVYSPKHFSEMKSLGMLKNPNSLMWYQMDCGDRFLDIDNITARILNEIGWNVSIQEGLKLNMYEGSNMVGPYTTTGIGNAFKKYKIVVRNDGSAANITDQSLRLRLFHKNGERYAVGINKGDTVINGTSLTLNLGKFVKEDIKDQIYRITEGGELEAELVFTYSADGIRGRTKVFRIALDARPVLRDITHKGAISRGNYVDATFGLDGDGIIDAFCKISYKGYNMYRQPSRERVIDPNTKKFLYYEYKLINLHPTDTARIEIYGINNYGRSAAQKIWYFYPSNPTYNPGGLSIGLLPRPYHCIYDIAGNIVFTGNDDEYAIVRKSLKPGYYFIKHFSEDGILTEEKIKIVDR